MPAFFRWIFSLVLFLVTISYLTSRHSTSVPEHNPHESSKSRTGSQASSDQSPSVRQHGFHWRHAQLHHPVAEEDMISVPAPDNYHTPMVQHNFSKHAQTDADRVRSEERRLAVKAAFKRCWDLYESRSLAADEVTPLSQNTKTTFGGWGVTLVDSLDSLWIMGFRDEFSRAVSSLDQIDFSRSDSDSVNIFETTIRYLGGFLSAYELSGDTRLLTKAVEVADLVLLAHDTPNHLPVTRGFSLRSAKDGTEQLPSTQAGIAEIGSMTLEFTRLSQITGDSRYFDAANRVMQTFADTQDHSSIPGMWPIMVNARQGKLAKGNEFSLGSMADSLYEYLCKSYALGVDPAAHKGGNTATNGIVNTKRMYEAAMDAAISRTLFRPMTPDNLDILIAGVVKGGASRTTQYIEPEAQHLTCFAGGMFALGGRLFENSTHVDVGRKLTQGCMWMYNSFKSGIMPEKLTLVACPETDPNCTWNEKRWFREVVQRYASETDVEALHGDETILRREASRVINAHRLPQGVTSVSDKRYLLRPEALESVFVLYRILGDTIPADNTTDEVTYLRDAGWSMIQHILKHTHTHSANAGIADVTVDPDVERFALLDRMESFWMSETLKYAYLLFAESEDVLSLDRWVFTTEAHPLRRPGWHGDQNQKAGRDAMKWLTDGEGTGKGRKRTQASEAWDHS